MESRIDLCSKGSLLQMLFGGLMLMVMCLQLYQVHFGAFFFFTRFLGNTSGWVFYILQLSSGAGYRYVLILCTTGLTTTPAISQHSLWSAVQTLRYGAFLTLKTRDTGDRRVSASILFFSGGNVCLLVTQCSQCLYHIWNNCVLMTAMTGCPLVTAVCFLLKRVPWVGRTAVGRLAGRSARATRRM